MSIRVIDYIVTANSISPATVQKGGLQGEHRATTLLFTLDEIFRNTLAAASDKIWYRFEAHTSSGLKNSTVPERIRFSEEGRYVTLEYPLENWLTCDGGNIRVYLIFSGSNVDDGQTIDLYTYPALLRLDAVPDAEFTDGENYDSITTLSVVARDSAARAVAAANDAKGSADAADAAKKQTEEARFALENGSEIVMLGGGAAGGSVVVELVVDEELSSVSTNTVQNRAIAAAINETKEELKAYTDNEIATFDFIKIVDSLGDAGLPNRLYLVPKRDAEGNDLFDEYIWANNKWEFITTKQIEIDLTPYVKKEDVVDYIVKQGVSGIWTYRKWKSGVAECWASCKVDICCVEQRNSIYVDSLKSILLPEELFVVAPTVNINAVNATGYNFLIAHIYSVDTSTVSYLPASTGKIEGNISITFAISAKGTWK